MENSQASTAVASTKSTGYSEVVQEWQYRLKRARPFIKWAGGKQPFLLRFASRFPHFSGRYVEPFLGSGSVFFYNIRNQQRPFEAVLGDTNLQLIRTFVAIRDNPHEVYDRLQIHQTAYTLNENKAEYYNLVRDMYNAQLPRVNAADFIFLNRAGWNGLYRVNQSGAYNVPYGNPKSETIVPSLNDLLNVSAALAQTELRATSWENTVSLAERGDFVFLDPPYYSDIVQSSSKYSKNAFSLRDHMRLAQALKLLDERGIAFILTSSGEDEMRKLYTSHNLRVETVEVPRSINSKTELRGVAKEHIVTGNEMKASLMPESICLECTEKEEG